MKLLIDTNVILDMVLKRKNCDTSMELFRKIKKYRADASITASAVTDLCYIIRKETHDVLLPIFTPAACIEMMESMLKNL